MSTVKHSVIAHVDQTTLLDANDKLQARKNINAVASLFSLDSKYLSISDTTDGHIDVKLNTGNAIINGTGITLNYNDITKTVELGHATTTAITPGAYKVGVDKLGHLVCSSILITASDVGAAEANHVHGNLSNDGKMTNTPVNVANGGTYAIAVAKSLNYSFTDTKLLYARNLFIDYSDTSRDRMYLSCTMEFLHEPLIGNGLKVSDATNNYVDINYDTNMFAKDTTSGKLYLKNPHTFLDDYNNTYKSSVELGAYKFACSKYGHITNVVAVTKADLTALGLSGSNTTYSFADGTTLGAIKFNGTNVVARNIQSAAGCDVYNVAKTMSGTIPPIIETLSTTPNVPLKWGDKATFIDGQKTTGLTTYDKPLGNLAFASGPDNKSTKLVPSNSYIVFSLTSDGGPFAVSSNRIAHAAGPSTEIGIQAPNVSVGNSTTPVYYDLDSKSFKECTGITLANRYAMRGTLHLFNSSNFTADGIFSTTINIPNQLLNDKNSLILVEIGFSGWIFKYDGSHSVILTWIGTKSFGNTRYKYIIPSAPNSASMVIAAGKSAAHNPSACCTLLYTVTPSERQSGNLTLYFQIGKMEYPTANGITYITSSNMDKYTNSNRPFTIRTYVRELGAF